MKEEIINFVYDNIFKHKINDLSDKGGPDLGYNSSNHNLKDSNGKLNTFYASTKGKRTPSTGFKIKPIDKRSITPSLQIMFQ